MALPPPEALHVLGGGSIGLLLASTLRAAFPSYPVQVITRRSRPSPITVCLQSPTTPPRLVPVPCRTNPTNVRHVIVATKAYQAREALQAIPHSVHIHLWCNGALSVRDELDHPHVHLGTLTHGVYREEDEDLVHLHWTGHGHIQTDTEWLAAYYTAAGMNALHTDQIEEVLWKKLAANCIINPLTAVHQIQNGVLLTEHREEQLMLLEEFVGVYLKLYPSSELPDFAGYVHQVLHDTKENWSSMCQDVREGRPTEIDYLNGYLLRFGECPTHAALVQRINTGL